MAEGRRRNRLAPFVLASLVAAGASDIWFAVALLHRASYALSVVHGQQPLLLVPAQQADHEVRVAAIANLLVLVLTAALFITWLFRIVKDVDRRRPNSLRYSPGWAIGGWFVPVLSLWRPKQVLNDAWRVASPSGSYEPDPPLWMFGWWAVFLFSNLLSGFFLYSSGETLSFVATQDRIHAIGDLANVLAAVLAVMVVRSLSSRIDRMVDAPGAQEVGAYGLRFNPAPGWPAPPLGWTPPMNWKPDPNWPAAPPKWQFWVS